MSSSAVPAQIPINISSGRHALVGLPNVEVLKEFEWDETAKAWILQIRLSPPDLIFNDFVPSKTEWFVSVDRQYPLGNIDFFPAKENGIVVTFPHQALNLEGRSDRWRDGKVCLSDPYSIFEDRFISTEPFTVDDRLRWHVERALGWLEHASKRTLLREGDFFELPSFPTARGNYSVVGFNGSKADFESWQGVGDTAGLFDYHRLSTDNRIVIARRFYGPNGKRVLVGTEYGSYLTGLGVPKYFGVWIRANSVPIVPPWQAPLRWGDLDESFKGQGIDLRERLDRVLSDKGSKDKIGRLLVIGCPIPEKVGEEPERMHWLAAELPEMFFKNSAVRGFRPSVASASLANRGAISPTSEIVWVESENWAIDQIRSRGSLPGEVLGKRIIVIGGGALGSAVAEMLVRGGVYDLTVCDGDRSKVGNLVRHNLDLRHLDRNKAKELAKHLNETSPWANVRAIESAFPSNFILDDFDVVVDCTGNQWVLATLASMASQEDKIFVSASMSFGSKRLYLYAGTAKSFPADQFRKDLQPWLEKDGDENADVSAPREGTGCWHPVFPARSDDVWLWGSIAAKGLSDAMVEPSACRLRVFEQVAGFGAVEEVSDYIH